MTDNLTSSDRAKYAASKAALDFIKPGMKVGLGTGSTAAWFVQLLAGKVNNEGLDIIGVPTSTRTRDLAASLGIKLTTLEDVGWLDVTVDGADEFDANLNLIKGGGGALLQEKIVASASNQMVVISDSSKQVATLGVFPLPIEVVKFGWRSTESTVEEVLEGFDVANRRISLREENGAPYVTDEGHYILDLHLNRIGDPRGLAEALNRIPGVVETGLFVLMADTVLVGYDNGDVHTYDRDRGDLGCHKVHMPNENFLYVPGA